MIMIQLSYIYPINRLPLIYGAFIYNEFPIKQEIVMPYKSSYQSNHTLFQLMQAYPRSIADKWSSRSPV